MRSPAGLPDSACASFIMIPILAAPEAGVAAEPAELDALLREADFVSIHTPLNDDTRHLVDAAFLAKMKPTAILVNTARGPIVDQKALYDALESRRIFAAGLDVTDPEPLPTNSPLLEPNNLVVCPHIASASWATRARMSLLAAENLIAGLKGERLPNCVNPEVYSAIFRG